MVLTITVKSQSAEVSYIEYNRHKSGFLISFEYPTISTGNKHTDLILNKNVRRDLLYDTLNTPIESAMDNMVSAATALWFNAEVTFNKNNVISIMMGYEYCAANCQNDSEAFVYSLSTGKRLNITDVIDTTLFYKNILVPDVNQQYENNINKISKIRDDSTGLNEDEKDYYDYYIESYKILKNQFKMSSFCLYNGRIEILDECTFNRIDSPMCPEVYFSYQYEDLRKYLKIKI
jgi:hypothetical protein